MHLCCPSVMASTLSVLLHNYRVASRGSKCEFIRTGGDAELHLVLHPGDAELHLLLHPGDKTSTPTHSLSNAALITHFLMRNALRISELMQMAL